ncbi:MAG TPA: DNA polymerase I [Selenomonadales bacterium]|nr:DNA polymerase I [Selenomonadales bacterium]
MPCKFVIIDGSSLVHRAFYALPLLTTASGQYTNAVYGLTTMLSKLFGDQKPDAVAVAFDKSRITFRTEAYAEYKAHRKATPRELSEQFPLAKEVLDALGIAVLEEDGFEADDIIGTLACQAARSGWDVIIVTGDRDALQLIGPSTRVMLTRKGITDMQVFDRDALYSHYGVTPEQITDLKGLMGDASDNIPGVPGIGEKTATKLIAEFGSIENLLDNLDQVSGKKLQENLRANKELAVLSKKLATIDCNMELGFAERDFSMSPDVERVRELFAKLEFKTLLAKIDTWLPGAKAAPPADAPTAPPKAETPDSYEDAKLLLEEARRAGVVGCCPIAGEEALLAGEMTGLGIAAGGRTAYIPAGHAGWREMMALLADPAVRKITYDAKRLHNACLAVHSPLASLGFDVMLAAYLLDPTASDYPLTRLVGSHLAKPCAWEDKAWRQSPDYAAWAAGAAAELYPVMEAGLLAAGLDKLYYEIELPLTEVLAAMETAGIKVDMASLAAMSGEIARKVDQLLGDIYHLAGEEFNVNSTKQLGVILFDKLKLPVLKKTKTGYSTDAEVLERLAGEHPLIDKLLEYRMLTKLKSTYLDGMTALVSKESGRIHTTFNQTVTATGRLSSSDPNLQNIPVRTEVGRRIRELFVPDEGYAYLLSADYSQIELRVLAHMAGDGVLIDAFRHNKDIHTATAAEVFGLEESQVTFLMRSRAKAVNFGIVYGISDYGLARDIGVPRKEAGEYIERYFSRYPGVKLYIDRMVADAREKGYVTTMFGRRRYLPEIHSSNFNQRSFAERTAMNTPIQGTAADIIKKAMIDVYRRLKAAALRSRILLQVHDELVLEVTADEVDQVAKIVKEAMEGAVSLSVSLTTDTKYGKSWAEAK